MRSKCGPQGLPGWGAYHITQLLGASGDSDGWQVGPDVQVQTRKANIARDSEKQVMPNLLRKQYWEEF